MVTVTAFYERDVSTTTLIGLRTPVLVGIEPDDVGRGSWRDALLEGAIRAWWQPHGGVVAVTQDHSVRSVATDGGVVPAHRTGHPGTTNHDREHRAECTHCAQHALAVRPRCLMTSSPYPFE